MQSFQQDCVDLAMRKFRRGEVDRRTLLAGLAAFGAAGGAAGQAVAQAVHELVMVNWGGLAVQGMGSNYGGPFAAANPGWKLSVDGSGPSAGRIQSMVQSGRVTWDICDSSAMTAVMLGARNMLNKIDYSIVKREDVLGPTFALEYGCAPYSFSSVLIYDSHKFPNGGPTSWADFWDLQKFPGTRLLRRDATGSLEAAQMALGKAPASLYPLDVRACLAKVRELRSNCVYWTGGADSEQFMRTGEAVMGQIWNTRAKVLEEESNGRFKYIWNQGLLQPGIMVSPKGNPGGEMVQKLYASMTSNLQGQVDQFKLMGNGPSNPRAAAMVPEELRRHNPTNAANVPLQVPMDGEWWAQNYPRVNADFIDLVTG